MLFVSLLRIHYMDGIDATLYMFSRVASSSAIHMEGMGTPPMSRVFVQRV